MTTEVAERILLSHYDIEGKAKLLYGEVDYNYKINAGDGTYLLKVSREQADIDYLDFQVQLLNHIKGRYKNAPVIYKNSNREQTPIYTSYTDSKHHVRLMSWAQGRLWSSVRPITASLRENLGQESGRLIKALEGFDHPLAHRQFEWDIAQVDWLKDHLSLFNKEDESLITCFLQNHEYKKSSYNELRKGVIHNDINDNNIIISDDLKNPSVSAIIDFGDACYTQIINDVAVTMAYAAMDCDDPLQAATSVLKGYHHSYPLLEDELVHLYDAVALRLIISVTKSALNKIKEPDNEYLQISEKPAWRLLQQWRELNPRLVETTFRTACDYPAITSSISFENWSKGQRKNLSDLFGGIDKTDVALLDLSVGSTTIGQVDELGDHDHFSYRLSLLEKENPNAVLAGGYLEPRPLYTTEAFAKKRNEGYENRTVHLGVDFWLPANTPVKALYEGRVITSYYQDREKEYGGLIILEHHVEDTRFYTLYGHLSKKSVTDNDVGMIIKEGEAFGYLGNANENGNWVPHLHFQIILDLLDIENDFPGVACPSEINIWKNICPDPNLLFKFDALSSSLNEAKKEEILNKRIKVLGKSLSISYSSPLHIVRGAGVYLMDDFGQKYLDTVNNVAHVGHEHPRVVKAGREQMSVLNTNTRYLHNSIIRFAEELLSTFPKELSRVHFVNSGSEANELALRMSKAKTGSDKVIAMEVGYHGNTGACVDISSYKFDGKGGSGAKDFVHIVPLPDQYRGQYRGNDCGSKYASQVLREIEKIQSEGKKVGAFICESIISCGGQIELPDGFLKEAYKSIRDAGGVCIADEVQTGCGRVGDHFWAFQYHNVIPDIVTIGKPIGNGHPLAAVVCTEEVADAFANGMEFFNTFGGNPVSSAIGYEVLRVIKEEGLQENAKEVGNYLIEQLQHLQSSYPIIGDVRGKGLFLGIELTSPDLEPLPQQANYLANRMREKGILMSTDGRDHNVMKIKPPIIFQKSHADRLLSEIELVLNEDFMKSF